MIDDYERCGCNSFLPSDQKWRQKYLHKLLPLLFEASRCKIHQQALPCNWMVFDIFTSMINMADRFTRGTIIKDKGVVLFLMLSSKTICISFKESLGCPGLAQSRIEQGMKNIAGSIWVNVPGQRFHAKCTCLSTKHSKAHSCTFTRTKVKLIALCAGVAVTCRDHATDRHCITCCN